jgi:hypothetical protein
MNLPEVRRKTSTKIHGPRLDDSATLAAGVEKAAR